jgi:putative ABC transport system permease protein
MLIVETLRVALTSIRGNLFRATLTMLGVIIGVGAVITMMALGAGAQRAVEAQLAALGANVLTVTTQMRFLQGVAREQMSLTADDAAALAAGARHVTAVVPEQQRRQQVKFGNRNLNLQVVGTTPDHPKVNGLRLARGRLFTLADDAGRQRVALLGGEVPEMLGSTPEALIGARITLKNVLFEVIGVYERRGAIGFSNPDDQVYVPLGTSQYRLIGQDRLQSIAVEVEAGTEPAQAMVEIERVLRREHGIAPGKDNDFAIVDRKQFLATQQQTTEILSFLLAGIAGVSLLVGGIGIMNIMLVTVTERTREIGLRKAVGATRTHILLQFLVESMTLCLLGGALGILLGIGGSALLSRLAGWQTYVSSESVLLAFGFSAAVGLVFGLWPASRAARLDPIEALRHE